MHDGGMPDGATPDTEMPGNAMPETEIPGSAMPDIEIPGSAVAGTALAGSEISGRDVPGGGLPSFEMPDFDVEAFITKLDGMGMKLTAIPLADGRFRVSRWCTLNAAQHARRIDELWTGQVGDDQARIDVLAVHLAKTAPQDAAPISSRVTRAGPANTGTRTPPQRKQE